MTKLIARLIMATMLFPLAIVVFAGLIPIASTITPRGPTADLMAGIWLVLYLFVGTYWVLLWRSLVTWSPNRIRGTIIATILALLSGVVFAGFIYLLQQDVNMAIGIGGLAPAVTFVLFTIWVWRETDAERSQRLNLLEGTPIECPSCGYDMRGLRATTCPECGIVYSLQQLLLARTGADSHEIDQHEEAPGT